MFEDQTTVVSEPSNPKEDAFDDALLAEFDDNDLVPPEPGDDPGDGWLPLATGVLQMRISGHEHQKPGIVSGLFKHTWSVNNVGGVPIFEDVSWTPEGSGLDINLSAAVDSWKLPSYDQRDETINN